MKPLCFVLMPFGVKREGAGRMIDFDAVYSRVIAPGVAAAGMEVIRADQEEIGGSIHKPMFERLMFCDYAVADITGANPNVYYELGIRHALRPRSTVLIFAEGTLLPFDIASQRGSPYRLDADGKLTDIDGDVARIAERLVTAHEVMHDDSPLFQLVEGMPRPDVEHSKADIFRGEVEIAKEFKDALERARRDGIEAVRAVTADPRLADLRNVKTGIIIDLMLSLRAVNKKEGHQDMVALYDRMPRELQHTRMVREQYGFALNRLGRHAEAEKVLTDVIKEYGASSETNGLLGRVYKDLWDKAKKDGRTIEARGHLRRAIKSYRDGFEADWRDAYPGVNAVTLMEMEDTPDPAQQELLPVVRYAATQRISKNGGDYWDQATIMELAVLARDPVRAEESASAALALAKEPFWPETTARNLGLIRQMREQRGEDGKWIAELEQAFQDAQRRLQGET